MKSIDWNLLDFYHIFSKIIYFYNFVVLLINHQKLRVLLFLFKNDYFWFFNNYNMKFIRIEEEYKWSLSLYIDIKPNNYFFTFQTRNVIRYSRFTE